MNFDTVERSLELISGELDKVEERRERILRESRDVISLASKAIVSIHVGKLKEARSHLKSANTLLEELKKVAVQDLHRYLVPPESEFVEASVLYSIESEKGIPSCKDLGVANTSYLLGLLDAVGEIKRAVYDRIRQGRTSEALELFSIMERLYVLLSPFAVYDHVAQGVRRKLDVARILVEGTRSAVTEEIRRSEFMKSIEELSGKLGSISK